MRTVAVPGGALTVRDHADEGPAVLLLHYWGGSAATWTPVTDRLAGHPVLAWDQRGWGDHTELPGPYGPDALAGDVEAVVGALGLREVVLVGHSQGGKVAQILARRRPAWLRGLVLVAPAPPRPPDRVTPEYREQLAHAYDTPATIAAALDTVLTASSLPDSLRDRAIRDSGRSNPAARREWPLRGIAADLGPGRIDVPAVVLAGEYDRVEPADVLERLLLPSLPASTTITVVPGAGHLLPLEAPDAVAEAIHRVLGRA